MYLKSLVFIAMLFASCQSAIAKCTPFVAMSYHGNVGTHFNENHPGIKCKIDEHRTWALLRNSYNEPALIYTYQKDMYGRWGFMAGAAFGYRDTILHSGTRIVPRPSFGVTFKPNKHMMFYGAPTGFQGDYIIGVELSLF
jgi:hypothetical protein